jgi:hypothetical protein
MEFSFISFIRRSGEAREFIPFPLCPTTKNFAGFCSAFTTSIQSTGYTINPTNAQEQHTRFDLDAHQRDRERERESRGGERPDGR